MIILFFILGLLIGGTILYFIYNPKLQNKIEIDNKTKEENNKIQEEYNQISKNLAIANEELINIKHQYDLTQSKEVNLNKTIEKLSLQAKESANKIYNQSFELASERMSAAADKMRLEYQNAKDEAEKEYFNTLIELENEFSDTMKKTKKANIELDKLLAQIRAATAAANREKQIQEKPEDFTINLSAGVLEDIKKLNVIKKELNNPRILSMLIWQNFIKTPLDILCDKTFGKDNVCGIYKLTNLLTNEIYVGQSLQCKERMRQHFKAGLGIDTPTTNKLYANMIEYGVWNFSIELLEKCPREELNEKEKYYINLYSSDHSLNSTAGNN